MTSSDKSRKKITFVSHESLFYGAPRSLLMLAQHLNQTFKSQIVTFGTGDLVQAARQADLPVTILSACNWIPSARPRHPLTMFFVQNALRIQRRLCHVATFLRLLKELRTTDMVYVNTVLRRAPVLAARLLGKRIVVHVREAENYLVPQTVRKKRQLRGLLNSCTEIICVSEAVRSLVLNVPGLTISSENVHTVYNGIEAQSFQRDPIVGQAFRKKLGISKEALVICFVGNAHHRKGLDVLLQAVPDLMNPDQQVHILIAGGTPSDIANFKSQYVTESLSAHVHFLGFCQDVRPVLWASDVFTMLSRCEPFARVNLEASSAGCAVVATTVDGNTEIFRHEHNALMVSPDSVPETTAALKRLIASAQLRETLAKAAHTDVSNRFSTETCHSRIHAILSHQTTVTGPTR